MNYAEKKSTIRRKIVVCSSLFICSVTITAVLLGFFVSFLIFARFHGKHDPWLLDQYMQVCFFGIPLTIIVIFNLALSKIKDLRKAGGSGIAKKLGAIQLTGTLNDYYQLRLRNIVEELSIASGGSAMPTIFYLENENNINAFAIGYSSGDAAIVVTKGALIRLNRAELEGVIGHEFGHILQEDMRLNTIFFGFIYVISLVYNDGKDNIQSSDWRDKIFGIPEILIGAFGMLCGRLITAYLSREEEYFADATAVQLTRQTAGIISALKKIGSLIGGSAISNSSLKCVNHMLFSESTYFRMIATHPSIIKRIQALEPNFNTIELKELEQRWLLALPDGQKEDELQHLPV